MLGLGLPAIVGGTHLPRVSDECFHRPSLSRPTRPTCHYEDESRGSGDDYGVCVTASVCSPCQIIFDEKVVPLVPPAHMREELLERLRLTVQVESDGKGETTRRTLSVSPRPVAPC